MKFLVGYTNDSGGKDALKLGIALAEMTQGSLVVCHIVPKLNHATVTAKIDQDYNQFLYEQAQKSIDKAKHEVPSRLEAEYIARTATSISQGLKQTAHDISADCIVIGSAKMAVKGQFITGSVASELLNHIKLPVALAPKGFHQNHNFESQLSRVSCAVSGTQRSYELAVNASEWAELFGVALRFVTFAVRDRDITPTAAGFDAENIVINEWRDQITTQYQQFMQQWDSDVDISLEIGDGDTWKKSIRSVGWHASELLIIGLNDAGRFKQMFVGKNAEKIIRYAFVPRLIISHTP